MDPAVRFVHLNDFKSRGPCLNRTSLDDFWKGYQSEFQKSESKGIFFNVNPLRIKALLTVINHHHPLIRPYCFWGVGIVGGAPKFL